MEIMTAFTGSYFLASFPTSSSALREVTPADTALFALSLSLPSHSLSPPPALLSPGMPIARTAVHAQVVLPRVAEWNVPAAVQTQRQKFRVPAAAAHPVSGGTHLAAAWHILQALLALTHMLTARGVRLRQQMRLPMRPPLRPPQRMP
jgi:hypothetical protein